MKKLVNKIQYRPEIDFLRAIAVSAVIIYHAKVNLFGQKLFQGGYLGVDIFFVISGYLITSIIFKELESKNNFSFTKFYLRRARRILPALFFVILISLPIPWFIFMPSNFVDFAKSILFSLGFSSNFYFYFTGLEYGAVSGLLKPLLHTWSLAVEEQFYILFPLLFVAGFIFLKKKLKFYVFFILVLSLLFAEFFSNKNPNLNFYILPSRTWELLVGSLIMFFENNKKFKISNNISNIMCLFGLVLIFFSFLYFYESIPNPNFKSLVPILGVVLILLFAKKGTLVTKFLSNKLFIGLGLISYSLYLWHYPIFAFARNLRITQSLSGYFIIGILILILSIASYFYIERPFRNKKFISDKNFIKIIIIFISSLLVSSFIIIDNNGFKNRFPNYDTFSLDYEKYLKEVRLKKYEFGNPQFTNSNKKNVLIIGNSHGRDTFNSLKLNEDLFFDFEFSILDTQIRCIDKMVLKSEFCNKQKMTKLQKKIFIESDILLISTHYNEDDLNELESNIELLRNLKKKIVLTTLSPSFYYVNHFSLVDEFYYKYNRLPNHEETILLEKKYYETMDNKAEIINKKLKNISKTKEVKLLKKKDLLCDEKTKRCRFLTNNNNKILYDNYHLTIQGANFVGKKIFDLGWLE